jgi:hypothetical protein
MHVGRYPMGHRLSEFAGYRAGTYTTRVFQPGFTFTTEAGFDSSGENQGVVPFDEHPTCDSAECFRLVVALSPETVESFESNLGTVEWITNVVSSPVEYWGATGTRTDFSIGDCPAGTCFLSLEGFQDTWGFQGGQSVSLLNIDVPGGPIGYVVAANQSRFDQYWTEVAEPILASIEFNDE